MLPYSLPGSAVAPDAPGHLELRWPAPEAALPVVHIQIGALAVHLQEAGGSHNRAARATLPQDGNCFRLLPTLQPHLEANSPHCTSVARLGAAALQHRRSTPSSSPKSAPCHC